MKNIVMMILAGALAIGCGGKKSDPNTPTSNTDPAATTEPAATGDGTPCTQEIAMVCPDDQIDACLKTPAEGDTHKCVAK